MPVVVGIFQNLAAVSKLNDALKAAGFSAADLIVIADESPDPELIDDGVQFRLTGEPDTGLLGSGRGMITSSGGTEVPGLGGSPSHTVIGGENASEDMLADLNVPDGRTDDYEEALDAGRAVAGYQTADVDKVKGIFSTAGANPIEVF